MAEEENKNSNEKSNEINWAEYSKKALLIDPSQISGFFSNIAIDEKEYFVEDFENLVFRNPYSKENIPTRFTAKGCPCTYPWEFLDAIKQFCDKLNLDGALYFPRKPAPMFVALETSWDEGKRMYFAIAHITQDIWGDNI